MPLIIKTGSKTIRNVNALYITIFIWQKMKWSTLKLLNF